MIGPRTDLGTLLAERAVALGDREFLTIINRVPVLSYRTLSFREFNAEVNRVARGLASRGVERGEPRRVYRRLQLLRGLEHEQIKSIFPRG